MSIITNQKQLQEDIEQLLLSMQECSNELEDITQDLIDNSTCNNYYNTIENNNKILHSPLPKQCNVTEIVSPNEIISMIMQEKAQLEN